MENKRYFSVLNSYPIAMFTITVSEEVKAKCPQYCGAAVYATVENTPNDEALWEEITEFTKHLRTTETTESIKLQPAIVATREAYRVCGKDPSRYRPSAEALRRRLLRGLELYRIDTLVDLINLVSLRTGYSIGGFDADKIVGTDLCLGIGKADEPFEGIGRGALNIEHMPVIRDAIGGDIHLGTFMVTGWGAYPPVIRDAIGGIGTPTSDHERTKMDVGTTHILAIINGYSGSEGLHEAAEMTVDLLQRHASAMQCRVWMF